MIRRPAGCLRIDPAKAKLAQIEFFDKDIDHANRIVLADPVFQAFRKQRALPAIHPLNKALHPILPQIAAEITLRESDAAAAFLHNQGHQRRIECALATSPIPPKAVLIDDALLYSLFTPNAKSRDARRIHAPPGAVRRSVIDGSRGHLLLAVLLFVFVGPLQAAALWPAHLFGIAFGLVLVAAVFIVSGSRVALAAILTAVALIVLATVLRLRHPSVVDIYLDARCLADRGLTLSIVVGRAVFAPGPVTFHRVIGAVLLYLDIGLIFVALFCFVGLRIPGGLNRHRPASGHSRCRWATDLLQLRDFDVGGLRRHRPVASVCARSR